MPSERIFTFWGLLLLIVPLVAARIQHGGSRVDRFFLGGCTLFTFLLLAFAPRMIIAPGVAAVVTIMFSGVVALVYLALSPAAWWTAPRLLTVLAIVDMAALAAIQISVARSIGTAAFVLLLLGVAGLTGFGAVQVFQRI